jgi:hydrogenase maturation protease
VDTNDVCVIGVGNALRGDDAAGLAVARALRDRLPGARVIESDGDGAALIDAWQSARFVVLIDAVSSGAAPGTVHRFDAHAEPLPAPLFHYSTHAVSVADAVELARALGTLPPRLVVYGIEATHFEAGAALSPAVQRAVDGLVEHVRREAGDAVEAEV